jgi:2-polyprenyl-6-methoxyphenol hydroxylase-like FAD-dependent oxidoreductase
MHEGGGIMLSPNALRIFDDLGLYKRVLPQGYGFEKLTFKNGDGETTGHYSMGNAKLYGYRSLRVRRQLVINELLAMFQEREVPVQFDRKFSKVLQESEDAVAFEFEDGTIEKADLLLGADGIHSSLRRYVCPNSPPKHSGFLALTSNIPISKLRFPHPNYHLPISITARPGFFLVCPQNANGEEVLVGTQQVYPEKALTGWGTLLG